VLLVAESEGRRESLLDLLRDHRIVVPSAGTLAEFLAGEREGRHHRRPAGRRFPLARPAAGTSVQFITETELFASTPQARRRRKQEQVSSVDALIKDLSELKVGDPVVHLNHGIGRYQGLVLIDLGEGASEFLHLQYADQATLYVPVSQLHLIGRYTGVSPDEAPLHRLGSGQWDKARRKAAEQVRDTAAELLNLYARRAAREGFAHRFTPHDYEAFATSFGFEETADQHAAIHAVVQDMISPKPMDRLVCGDVGFGKTEVALARRLRRRARRQAGGDPGADHPARRAALPDPGRPLCAVAGEDRRAFAFPQRRRRSRRRLKAWQRARWTSSSARTSCCRPT
jgi:transcription-repair coupling factor (superfamily II helicase)